MREKLLTKSDSMLTLACEQVLHVWVRKCLLSQPNAHTTFFICDKNRSTNQNAHTTNSHVKNIVSSEKRIYFSRMTHVNLYTHIRTDYFLHAEHNGINYQT